MGKFSDSPYFLLKDYFTGASDQFFDFTRPIIEYDWPVEWEDWDYVVFEDRTSIIWNLHYYYDPNLAQTDGSYLVGLWTNIVTKGDGLIELWVKEIDEPYKQFLPITLRWSRLDDTQFIFDDSDLWNIQEGTLTHSITGLRYGFDFFDGDRLDYADIIENGRETYFRKDSLYHEWIERATEFYSSPALSGGRGHETDIRNFTNYDTIFSYFGKIYKYVQDENEFRIIFDGLMEYVMRAIPEYQRTPKFDEFMEIFFDREWHEIYNQLKNIWTLVDPMEVDKDFLGYLSKYYHMYDLINPTLFRQREFVRDLIWLLKRKGTYVEFYIIWRVIANTVNALNIYEKWHEKDIVYRVGETPDTHVQDDEWQEYLYVEKPEYRYDKPIGGADIGWYNRTYGLSGESIVITDPPSGYYNYPVKVDDNPMLDIDGTSNADIPLSVYQVDDTRVLSTHYKLEIDVSTEPLLPDAIINESMWDELWKYWEYLRPVNRVVEYNILIAPITDFSGDYVSLYESSPIVYDLTKLLIDLRTDTGWIETFTTVTSACSAGIPEGCNWVMTHPLNSKVLHTAAVNESFNEIIPDDIEIVDKQTVIFHFNEPTTGYGLLKKADSFGIGGDPSGDGEWRMYHYLNTNEIVIETHALSASDSPDWKYFSEGTDSEGTDGDMSIIDTDFATIDSNEVTLSIVPASSGEYVYVQPIGDEQPEWVLPHRLYYQGVIVSVFNWNHEQIHEYELVMRSIDECVIRFDSAVFDTIDGVSGYAVLIPVANFSLEHLANEFINILRNGATWRGAEQLNDLRSGTVAASGEIEQNEIYETEDFIYINIKLGPEIEGSFREFGIYSVLDDLIVYTKNSEIYKPAGTTLVLHFRVEKTAGSIINT